MTEDNKNLPAVAGERGIISAEVMLARHDQIALLRDKVMRKGTHYGVIPGVKKPTLFKPGAEVLCEAFALNPEFEVLDPKEIGPDFVCFLIRCRLVDIRSGAIIATGLGGCNTYEEKYRFRTTYLDDVPIPQEYWKTRDPNILGGPNRTVKKQKKKWVVIERFVYDNPLEYLNTILKIAAKRAHVAATLTATGASELFTQDVEDLPEDIIDGEIVENVPAETSSPDPAEEANRRARIKDITARGAEAIGAGNIKTAELRALQKEVLNGASINDAPLIKLDELHARLIALVHKAPPAPPEQPLEPAEGPPPDLHVEFVNRVEKAADLDALNAVYADFQKAATVVPMILTTEECADITARYKTKKAQLKAAAAKGGA